jgi:hypothetical protein
VVSAIELRWFVFVGWDGMGFVLFLVSSRFVGDGCFGMDSAGGHCYTMGGVDADR